jgi:hypothetical protein
MKNCIFTFIKIFKTAAFAAAAFLFAVCEQNLDGPGEGAPAVVAVTGKLRVGEVLRADVSALGWDSADVSYQWGLGESGSPVSGNFIPIPGAVDANYTLVNEDENRYIMVIATRLDTGAKTGAALGPVGPPAITWTATADGANGAITSTRIKFTFDRALTGLTAENITVTGGTGSVTTGGLGGSGTNWTLALTGVGAAGNVSLTIDSDEINSGPKDVTVFRDDQIVNITWEAKADGAAGVTTSTRIDFTFSGTVEGLTADNITVTDGTGALTKGELNGSGTSRTLALNAVSAGGDVSVVINRAGIESGGKTVAVYKQGENQGSRPAGNALTAEIQFVKTANDTSIPTPLVNMENRAEETWNFEITEPAGSEVYFAVSMQASQTITVEGTDAELLTRADAGTEWDGLTASDTLVLFKVHANKPHNGKPTDHAGETYTFYNVSYPYHADEYYDSQFEGDDFAFTLKVAEDGKTGRTVNVNLERKTDGKMALFIVRYDGNGAFTHLERQTGIKKYLNITGPGTNSHTVNFDTATAGTRLIDMLVHIDQGLSTAADNGINTPNYPTANASLEYLVRVVADERLDYEVYISYGYKGSGTLPTGKIRLRGAGSEARWIKPTSSNRTTYSDPYTKYFKNASLISSVYNAGLITFKAGGTLQLEKNITIAGNGASGNYNPTRLIYLDNGARLIMKNGAVIRDHVTTKDSAIYLAMTTSTVRPSFRMEGGMITNNIGTVTPIHMGSNKNDTTTNNLFVKTGGTITGNKASIVAAAEQNGIFCLSADNYTEIGNDNYPK